MPQKPGELKTEALSSLSLSSLCFYSNRQLLRSFRFICSFIILYSLYSTTVTFYLLFHWFDLFATSCTAVDCRALWRHTYTSFPFILVTYAGRIDRAQRRYTDLLVVLGVSRWAPLSFSPKPTGVPKWGWQRGLFDPSRRRSRRQDFSRSVVRGRYYNPNIRIDRRVRLCWSRHVEGDSGVVHH